jgi:hypothetical protein
MHCAVAVILGDLGPEQKQERETDGKVFHPCLHMQIAASFSTVDNFVQNDKKCEIVCASFQTSILERNFSRLFIFDVKN